MDEIQAIKIEDFQGEIQEILKGKDLNSVTAKSIRIELENRTGKTFDSQEKSELKNLILSEMFFLSVAFVKKQFCIGRGT